MILLIILFILLIVGIYGERKSEFYGGIGYFILSIVSGTLLLTALMCIIIPHTTVQADIIKYNTTKETIAMARADENNVIERTELTKAIIEINTSIASNKYYNDTWLDIFIPDQLTELKPLK